MKKKEVVDVSWAYLNARLDTLTKMGQEGFDLEAKIAKAKDTIEKSQQSQNLSSPEVEVPVACVSPSQAAPPASEDNPPSGKV